MGLDKICIVLAVLFVFVGVACGQAPNQTGGAEKWIKENPEYTSVRITGLTTTIHIHVKNNKDHVQYFKISQKYFMKGTNDTVDWVIDWTDPPAVKMVKSVYPEAPLSGDYGWEIQSGQTREISFKLNAIGRLGDIPSYIGNLDSQNNTYWPLIPEPGLFASWFHPNELEMLNPNLDLKLWRGTFTFTVTNVDRSNKRVAGIVRAPIVPLDSKLTYYNYQSIAFIDKDFVNANTIAWNIHLNPGESKTFIYTYEWPYQPTAQSETRGALSGQIPTTCAATTPTVPTKETGVPYGLFIIGAIITGAGVVYAKFMR